MTANQSFPHPDHETFQRSQFRAIFAASSEGIALLNGEARFIEVNSAFARLFAAEPAALVGRDLEDLLALPGESGNTSTLIPLFHAVHQREKLPDTEIELFIRDRPHALSVSVTPVVAPGEPVTLLLLARDISDMRTATRVKANVLSLIAHELRAPLNTINGYLDLALTGVGGELNEQQSEFVQRARASSEHLYALLENLLLIARADASQLRLHAQVISLAEVVALAVEELELLAADHHIVVEVAIPSTFPYLYADSVRLQQVLRNLLSNALHFAPAGGRVLVSARTEPRDQRAGEEPTQVAVLQVRDDGCGIAPEYHQRIFERFFQIPNTHAGGQGLGLAIVKLIVELHGGMVAVESAPGQGSTFTCRLPCVVS